MTKSKTQELKERILSEQRKKGHGILKDGPTAELVEYTINLSRIDALNEVLEKIINPKIEYLAKPETELIKALRFFLTDIKEQIEELKK